MQDSHCQLNRLFISKYWGIVLVILLTPILLGAILPILPTHDDWATTIKPDFNPFFIKERFLFYGYHWRPFDAMMGYVLGMNPQVLYPALNHYCIVIGHAICAILVFKLLSTLGFTTLSKNITTVYFFIVPATMATVSAVDGMNQVYALVCGIISFLFYVKLKKRKYVAWISMLFIATWFKENGLMWALMGPILAYGFDFIDQKCLKKDIFIGLGVMIAYALAITFLPKDIIIHPDYEPGVIKTVKNIIKFLFTTFITIDYIYLLHQPSHNFIAAFLTFALTLPFLYYVFIRNIKQFFNKKMICTVLCMIIAVSPHLGTVFSMMHTYAGLAMLAMLIAYSLDSYVEGRKPVIISFILLYISAIIIDIHLINASVDSGQIGKQMAQEAIQKTENPVKSVYVIIIEDDYPKLSSFCVIPNEAFGWGQAARYETNYKWPEAIEDTTIERSADALKKANKLGLQTLNKQQHDCIWIVDHDHVNVVKK
jgi:hypothetical protein